MKIALAQTLRNYDKKNLPKDIVAGLIIMAVSIPISMGYKRPYPLEGGVDNVERRHLLDDHLKERRPEVYEVVVRMRQKKEQEEEIGEKHGRSSSNTEKRRRKKPESGRTLDL